MDLPNLLNRIRHKDAIIRRLLAIEITATAIKSAVWQVQGNHTEVVAVGSIQAWETDDVTDLITAIDASLSEACAGLESEPDEVVFGLPETWVGSEGIAEGKKSTLKQITQKLNLKPVGFVVTTEAVIQHLRDLEGGPPSAILINVNADNIAVSLACLGQLQGTQVVGRSESISSDVEEGLARFPRLDNLPSRMILYDSREDLESAKQALISHDWQAHLPFLHFPKIESLAKDFTIKAISLSGGQEVAQSLGYTQEISLPDSTEPEPTPEAMPAPAEEFAPLPDNQTDFGFQTLSIDTLTPPPPVRVKTKIMPQEPSAKTFSIKPFLNQLATLRSRLFRIPRIRLPSIKIFIVLPLILVSAIAIAGIAYWQLVKATVILYLAPKPLTKTISFTLNPKISTLNVSDQMLPAKQESVKVTDSQSIQTTGTKTVGERAKGTVTLYNRTTSPKSFVAGTTIKYQNLRFTLDKDVNLASASTKFNPDFSITTEPSKTTVTVTAVDIGEQFNLGVNTQFSLANFATDSYIGSNSSPFTGGSARQVAAVADADRKALKEALSAKIASAVSTQVKNRAQGQQVISTNKQTIEAETYSAKVGEEAEELSLSLTLEQTVYTYDLLQLTVLAQQLSSTEMLPDYQIQASGTQVNVISTTPNDDGTVTVKAETKLMLMPIVDSNTITANLTGKSVTVANQYLSTLNGYADSTITISPKLPGVLNKLPFQSQNIHLNIETK